MLQLFPQLRIHVWGGLGSQLFAVAAAIEISKKMPKRKLLLVLHSSGVTRRDPEICNLFPEFKYKYIDDFSNRAIHDSKNKNPNFKNKIIQLIRNSLLLSGFIAQENEDQIRQVKLWTMQVRGHYFHRKVNLEFLKLLGSRLEELSSIELANYQSALVIHYRLGDLLELSNKSPIDSHRIARVVNDFKGNLNVIIFSDSTDNAMALLQDKMSARNVNSENLDTVNTLWASCNAHTFIGTSSKISYWIVLIRIALGKNSLNFLPAIDYEVLKQLGYATKIDFYD